MTEKNGFWTYFKSRFEEAIRKNDKDRQLIRKKFD